ncbi:MAG: GIY-YIG nuclease family protein [bacterium]|nr:GIY-YIG nuclease family protein [bacterium]
MSYFVYILECKDKTLYSGITTNLDRRLIEHNSTSKGAKYTKVRRPVVLKYSEEYKTRSEALKREYVIKQLKREEKMRLLESQTF